MGTPASLPATGSFDLWAALLCVAAMVALFRFHVGVLTLVIGSAAAGMALQATGLI